MNDTKKCHSNQNGGLPKVLKRMAIAVFVLGGAYYLWDQHKAHVLQYLPFAFFLLCPLMHLFPGGCHGHKKHQHSEEEPQDGGSRHA